MVPNHVVEKVAIHRERNNFKKKASIFYCALAVSLLILAVVSTVSKPLDMAPDNEAKCEALRSRTVESTEPLTSGAENTHRNQLRSPNRFLQSQEGPKLLFDGVYRINTRHESTSSENLLLRYFRFFEKEQQVIEITTRSTLEEISPWFYPDGGHEHIYTGNYELSDDNRITFSTHPNNQYDGRLEPGGGLVLNETSSYAFYTNEVYSFVACIFPPPTPPPQPIEEPIRSTNPTPEPTPPPYWEFTDTTTEVN